MKVVALGDAHLGRTSGPATSEGINTRERDFDDSFSRAVDLALAQQPDLFVWLGDIFDRPNPTYRSYRVAQRELAKIREFGIPLVSISGNHDTPRIAGTGSPYRPLEDVFTGFRFAPGFEYRAFEFPGLIVHCVPQMANVQDTLDALEAVKSGRSADRVNLLLTHPRLPQVEPRYPDLNEITVDASALDCDLVLLGHYHTFKEVTRGMWYAGATDGFDFSDEYDTPKGVVVLDTDAGAITHVPLGDRRPMVMPDIINALGLGPDEVTDKVANAAANTPEGSVVKIVVDGVAPEVWSQVDPRVWKEAGAHVLWMKVDPRLEHAGVQVQGLPELAGVQARFESWMEPQEAIGLDRDALVARGKQYLADAVADAAE
ncbi:MAG TPA: DNA repair exonuclease [Acidimicrobiales bacterium]|nr:DNA repair exonuclease [Acidimicrobiales bacterium]